MSKVIGNLCLAVFFTCAFMVLLPVQQVHAHPQATPTASSTLNQVETSSVSVTPAVVHLDLSTDKPEALLEYVNHSSSSITIALRAQNFAELELGYKPSFFSGKTAENYQYGLASWMSLSTDSLTLGPNETATLKVSIDAAALSPGAHYGTVIAQIGENSGNNPVKLQRELASLIFVRTHTGKEVYTAELQAFSPNRQLLEFPKSFLMRVNNTGNTDIVPYGLVEVFDMGGHRVAKGIMNQDSLTTLPETIRRYDIPVTTNTFLFPEQYRAVITMHYGTDPQFISREVKFYSLGSLPSIPVALIIAAIFIVLTLLFRTLIKKSKRKGHAGKVAEQDRHRSQ